MKRFSLASLILVLLLTVRLFSHELPVTPVNIVLKLDPQVIRVRMEANGYYWNNEILRDKYDPDQWPQVIRERAKNYVDQHFVLKEDGQTLSSQLVGSRYMENPWDRYWEGKISMDFAYPCQENVKIISGKSDFYSEEWKERPGSHPGSVPRQFWTVLKIPGAKNLTLLLPLDKPDFEVPIEEAKRTNWQIKWESFFLGMNKTLLFPPFVFFIFAMALFWFPPAPLKWTLFASMLISGYFIPIISSTYSEKLSWMLLSLISAGIIVNLKNHIFMILCSGCTFFWGQIFERISGSIVSALKFLSLSGTFFLVGSVLAGAALAGFFYLILTCYLRHLKTLSETMWMEIFASRRRLAGIVLLILGLYNIFQAG